MSAQLALFDQRLSIQERAREFDDANPHVFEALRLRALRAKRKGFRPGIGCLFEVLRWSHGLSTQGDEFKLNNDYRAYYARVLMEREPELDQFFEVRRCRSDGQ